MLDNLTGKVVTGKWNRRIYRILRILGSGENGLVYLAERDAELIAIKVSEDSAALSLEWERMREMGQALISPCPRVYEMDDVETDDRVYAFFAMEYIEGGDLRQYAARMSKEQFPAVLLEIAGLLHAMHQKGYAFGDLKPENVLVKKTTLQPVLIDFGGVTPFGAVIKEFTEIYDRSFWGYGARKADEHYDFFALAMVGAFLCLALSGNGKRKLMQLPPGKRKRTLRDYFLEAERQYSFANALHQVVAGKILDYESLCDALAQNQKRQIRETKRQKRWDGTDWALLFSVLVFTFTIAAILLIGGHQSVFVIQ